MRPWRGSSPRKPTQTLTEDSSLLFPLQNWCCFQRCPWDCDPGKPCPSPPWRPLSLYFQSSVNDLSLVRFLIFRTVRALSCCNSGNSALTSSDEVASCVPRGCVQRPLLGGRGRAWAHASMSSSGMLAQGFHVKKAPQFTGRQLARTVYTVRNILPRYALLFLSPLSSGLVASYVSLVLAQLSAVVSTAPKLSLILTVES